MNAHRDSTLNLPEPLRLQFLALEQRLWRMDTLIAAAGSAGGLILSYVLLFASDRFWDTPRWLRTVITLFGTGVTVCFVYRWLVLWIWNRRDYRSLSGLVQRHYRRLGDRLLGIVELADETKRPPNISAALCHAAIRQVATEAEGIDFQRAVATRRPRNFLITALALLTLTSAAWLLAPQAGWNALLRWLLPVSSVARYTFVSLSDLPDHLVVPYGEPFEIACSLSYRSFWHPARARCQYDRQPSIEAQVRGGAILFRIPGQTRGGVLALQIGDDSRRVRIDPTFRPDLKRLTAHIERPAYLQHPAIDEEVRNGTLPLLEGSRVVFRGKTTRALATASLDTGKEQTLRLRGDEFSNDPMSLDGIVKCSFTWEDCLKLKGVSPWVLTIRSEKDLPPQARCRGLAAATAMLADEILEIKAEAEDDYGMRELGLTWEFVPARGKGHSPVRRNLKLKQGGPQTAKLEGSYRFSPAALNIPPETVVTLKATGLDYFPGRKHGESPAYQIYILSREEHAELIRKQLEDLLARLEELNRREETLKADSQQTRDLPAEKLAAEKAAQDLGEQSAEQSNEAEELERLVKQGLETMREALRNPDLPEELMSELARELRELEKLAQDEMQKAAEALKSSQAKSQGRAGELDRALQLEREILQALHEMQKQMAESIDRMQAKTLAQRLRKVGKSEKQIGETLEKMLPETIGRKMTEMAEAQEKIYRSLVAEQERDNKESLRLHEEIGRFFERTQQKRYEDVHREMTETKTLEEMESAPENIRQNLAVQTIQSTAAWAQRFGDWAGRLDSNDASRRPKPSGGSSRPMTDEEREQMLDAMQTMTRLMRLREQEENLRKQTEMLEEGKGEDPDYEKKAKDLAAQQQALSQELAALARKPSLSRSLKTLGEAEAAMNGAGSLLGKPETGQETVGNETRAIDLLNALVEQMAGQCGENGECMGMALLMQMGGMGMGTAAGPNGGGSTAGGTTDRKNARFTGSPGGTPDARMVEKVAGKEAATLPVEYRELMQGYFHAIEEETP